MAFNLPKDITPTPPPNERPIPTGSSGAGAWNPSRQPYANPNGTQDDQFAGPLEEVHRIWSNALDDGDNTPAPSGNAPPQPTPFYDDLRKSTSVPTWKPLAEQVSRATGVPPDVLLGLVDVTSGGDPQAQLAGGRAAGLAGVPLHQFPEGADPHDPALNLETAARRVAQAHERLGDWDKAAAAATGFASPDGNPRVLGPGADGFGWMSQFRAARQRYAR